MISEVVERRGVQFGGSEHSRASRAGVQRRVFGRAAAISTSFANQRRSSVIRLFPRPTGPVLFLVACFASGALDQALATRTAEECKRPSCLGILQILGVEPPAPRALPAILALVRVHIGRRVTVLHASCAHEHPFRMAFVVFYRLRRPCLRRVFRHARRTPVHVSVALLVRKLLSADATHVRTGLWLLCRAACLWDRFNGPRRDGGADALLTV